MMPFTSSNVSFPSGVQVDLPDELKITLPSANSKWLRAFHAFTRRPALLPMRVNLCCYEYPDREDRYDH